MIYIKFSNLIILILVFTIILNFTLEVKTQAAALTIFETYGPKAAELILFILSAATAGVIFDALEEANAMYDNYQMWGSIEPPPNNDWKNALIELLRFGTLSIAVGGIITNIRDYFQSIGAVEGDNVLLENYYNEFDYNDYKIRFKVMIPDLYPEQKGSLYCSINGSDYYIVQYFERFNGLEILDIEDGPYNLNIYLILKYWTSYNDIGNTQMNYTFGLSKEHIPSVDEGTSEIVDGIEYNVSSDSLILDNRDPFEIPEWYQLNIIDIVPIEKVTNSQGIEDTIYEGTEEELFDELIDSITWEDLQSSQLREPYILTETQSGTKIETGQASEAPFPDIEVEPIEDTSQFQGENIGLLKSIVNWLSNILKAIQTLPEKFAKMLKTILIPQPDYIKTKLDTIKTDLEDKIPIEIPEGVNMLKGITPIPIPDGYIDDDKVFDASYVNNMAETVKEWQRWFWYILIILMGMNNCYKLIRGTDLINFKNYEGGEGK